MLLLLKSGKFPMVCYSLNGCLVLCRAANKAALGFRLVLVPHRGFYIAVRSAASN